jgi:hypothetical protein
MSRRADIEEVAALGVLWGLGLVNYAWWGIRILAGRGIPEWARARSSYPS